MPNPASTPADPDLIVALETSADDKGVKELAPYRTSRGNPVHHYVKPCTFVLADGRRFASTLSAEKRKDLPDSPVFLLDWIARGMCRASFLNGKFIGYNLRLTIGG